MRKVLLVIPRLDYSGPARLLCLLATSLPRNGVRVCVLGENSPWCDELRAAGVGIQVLGWRRTLDLRPLWTLTRMIGKDRPEVVHAWGFGAAWPLLLTTARRPGNLFFSDLPPRRLSLSERWLLRRCGRVIAFGQAESAVYQRLGVAAERLRVVPPAITIPAQSSVLAQAPGLPADSRVLLAVGPIARHKGHRDAVWAFDILRCLYDDLHLVIAGSGPDEERVRRFAETIRVQDFVHFPGPVADLSGWLARAEVVWVPSLREGGRQTALEAMAAGRPVVASRLPGLAEVIADGRTGFLVTPGDKADLSRQTRILLDRPELRRSMGEAGRQHVEEHFPRANMVEAFVKAWEAGPA
jgi:glycosyltransferase involved in cell wall biosynthesis